MELVNNELPESVEDFEQALFLPSFILTECLRRASWTWEQLSRREYPPVFAQLLSDLIHKEKKSLVEAHEIVLRKFQLACLSVRRSWWISFWLRNHDNPDLAWSFWDFQIPLVDCRDDAIVQAAPAVGKSRNIEGCQIEGAMNNAHGSSAVVAPYDAHVREIITAIEWQLHYAPLMHDTVQDIKRTPYTKILWRNGHVTDFRPTGTYGTSLRGLHCKTRLDFDEATKAKNSLIFEEFWGRGMPGAQFVLSATPDGDRACEFYQLCERARAASTKGKRKLDDGSFRFFKFSKKDLPETHWNEKEKNKMLARFGSESTGQWQRVVEGEWGDIENTVFPWVQFSKLIKFIPEFQHVKITVDATRGLATVTCVRYEPSDQEDLDVREVRLYSQEHPLAGFDIADVLRTVLGIKHHAGLEHFGGCDLGYDNDPSEILVKVRVGKVHRVVLHVHMAGVSYDQQAEAVNAVDDVYDSGANEMRWGVDTLNAGIALMQNLHNLDIYAEKDFASRLFGFKFSETMESTDSNGEPVLDSKGKPVKSTAKELATDILVGKMQRRELEYPRGDHDIENHYVNHTYRIASNGRRIFSKGDDHVIDADRNAELAIGSSVQQEEEYVACGVSYRS